MPATRASNDALARSLGYPDAATMLAWRQRQLENQGPAQTANVINQPFSMDTVRAALALHPTFLLQHVLDKINAAIP